ncbi:hypothetical protein [Ruminococcus sp. Marseille-P6503]|uniref:hypothetical protein n=1 Tax=Ruminococcus sp. Marseille-P6503 TaxID=2364796 RepID=UPI000F5421DE|nr:hypothetical protein [Ruminococcus sp. Marseille-P6503]
MIKLCEFIGELVADIADARKIADSNSVALSQSYHADPFLKGMPVPHYTIDEAEVKVPVSVSGVVSNSRNKAIMQSLIVSAVKLKLPQLLNNQLKSAYVKKQKKLEKLREEKQRASAAADNIQEPAGVQPLEENAAAISDELQKKYAESSDNIARAVAEPMNSFLETANFEIIKLLDIKDKFVSLLKLAVREEFQSYAPEDQPVGEDDLDEFTLQTGTAMFFEFKQMSENDKGVFVEPNTGKMNEYGSKDNLMYITLKIREQDLDLIVEDSSGSSTQRFLSLN